MHTASERVDISPPLTVAVVFVRDLLSGARAKGIDCDGWLSEAGIDPALLAVDGARVTLQQYGNLLRVTMAGLNDETLGFLTRKSKPGSSLLQARAALGAPDLEAAIRRVAHVFGLLHDDVSLLPVTHAEGGGVGLQFHDATVQRNAFLHAFLLRAYWRLFAWFIGGDLPPLRVDFAFARPHYSEGLARIFPAPWQFDATMSAIWFPLGHLRMPLCRDEVALAALLKEGPLQIVMPRRDHGTAGRVRLYLQRSQPQWPDLERTAQAMAMSTATLQRQLAAEGTSFQSLKDQTRREIAIYRLHTSDVPLAKLATELGFADSSSFQYAFKCWTGSPPGRYRRGAG